MGLQLTASGMQFLAHARAIVDAVEDAVESVRPGGVRGRVSVGCFSTLAPFYLPSIIQSVRQRFGELEVDVTEVTAEQVEPLLLHHLAEVVLTYDLGLGPQLHREVLATVPLYAAVSEQHPLAEHDSVSLADLVGYPMVLLDMPVSRDYFLQTFQDHGLRPEVRYRFGSFETVRVMVAEGHGFTLLNQKPSVGYTYPGTQLRHLRIRERTRPLPLVLARLDGGSPPTRRAEAFIGECRRVVNNVLEVPQRDIASRRDAAES